MTAIDIDNGIDTRGRAAVVTGTEVRRLLESKRTRYLFSFETDGAEYYVYEDDACNLFAVNAIEV